MIRRSALALAMALLAMAFAGSAAYGQARNLAQAAALSKETGFPLLVISNTFTSCPVCQRSLASLKQELKSDDAEMKQLVSQFITYEIRPGNAEFDLFTNQYKPQGNNVVMFIVSAKGEEIHNGLGFPTGDGMKSLLRTGIERTGGVKRWPNPELDRALARAVEQARKFWDEEKRELAVNALVPHISKVVINDASIDIEREFAALVEEYANLAKNDLENVSERLHQSTGDFAALVDLAVVDRTFGKLPQLAEPLAAFSETWQTLPGDQRQLIEQLARARNEETVNAPAAERRYKGIIAKHAEAPAGKLAQSRLEAMAK